MVKTIVLPFEDWGRVRQVVTDVFGNAMPEHPGRASFVALEDAEHPDRISFAHVETIYHVAGVYIDPRYGPKERTENAMQLIRDVAGAVPDGYSGIWLSDRRIDRIAGLVGARLVHSEQDETDRYFVYRKDR